MMLVVLFQNYTQGQEVNYDESKVPEYRLPEVLVSQSGIKISDASNWMEIRRPEILSLFEENMYGKIPGTLNISSYRSYRNGYQCPWK